MNTDFKKIAAENKSTGAGSSSVLLFVILVLIASIVYWASITELDKVIRGDERGAVFERHDAVARRALGLDRHGAHGPGRRRRRGAQRDSHAVPRFH